MVKKVEGNTFEDNSVKKLQKHIEDMINGILKEESVSSPEKIKSIYNNDLQILRKNFESRNQIINKLLVTRNNRKY